MPTARVLQHLYSSVERGLTPTNGRGFQTVKVSQELVGTEDLKALERASYYAVGRDRRRSHALPVKETFLRLPSGKLAVGRTQDWGSDSLGREGNYLAHHLVFEPALLQSLGSPFPLLDALQAQKGPPDLTPGLLPPLELDLKARGFRAEGLDEVPAVVLEGVARAFAEGMPKPVLLVGKEAASRNLLAALFELVVLEERLERTFSSHFYESDHLRAQYAFVTVESRVEAPANRQNYLAFDLESGECPELPKPDAYAVWLGERMAAHDWNDIRTFNAALAALRAAKSGELNPPESPGGRALLWKWEAEPVVAALKGRPALIARFLKDLPSPASLAHALLAFSPAELCGSAQPSAINEQCLAAVRTGARGRDWTRWVQQWLEEPLLASFLRDADPWWKKAIRKLPVKLSSGGKDKP